MTERAGSNEVPKTEPTADAFHELPEITPALERRLHAAGILTFADLADLTPNEAEERLGKVPPTMARKLRTGAWVGEARARAEEASGPPKEAHEQATTGSRDSGPTDHPQPRMEAFTLKLSLDADGAIERTTILHARSKVEEAWPGWASDRLQQFVQRYCPPSRRPTPEPSRKPAPVPQGGNRLSVELSCGLHRATGQGEDMLLELDLGPQLAPESRQIGYTAELRAQALGTADLTPLATVTGSVRPGDGLKLAPSHVNLPEALHHIYLHLELDVPHEGKVASQIAVRSTRWYPATALTPT
jgi:hypothetical protein